jgi:hypothetical protein
MAASAAALSLAVALPVSANPATSAASRVILIDIGIPPLF